MGKYFSQALKPSVLTKILSTINGASGTELIFLKKGEPDIPESKWEFLSFV